MFHNRAKINMFKLNKDAKGQNETVKLPQHIQCYLFYPDIIVHNTNKHLQQGYRCHVSILQNFITEVIINLLTNYDKMRLCIKKPDVYRDDVVTA